MRLKVGKKKTHVRSYKGVKSKYHDRSVLRYSYGVHAGVGGLTTNTVFIMFGDDLVVSEETVESVTRALQADCDDDDRPTNRMHQT